MKNTGMRFIMLILLMSPSLAMVAAAESDTFTQVGSIKAGTRGGGPPGWQSPIITFQQEFDAPPDVIVSFNHIPRVQLWNPVDYGIRTLSGNLDVKAEGITSKGFQAVISSDGYSSAGDYAGISWIAVGRKPPLHLSGVVIPKYIVLTVIYAPPGTDGGHSTSSVSYQAGSTTGTSISASQSFKSGNANSFEATGTIFGSGVSFEYSRSRTDAQSMEIKKSTTATITQLGPSQDGINHDEDEIWLLLKPHVSMDLTSTSAAWMLTNVPASIQRVYVGWLNGHESMPAGIATAFRAAGITALDYTNILARDPLANDSSAIDSNRYVLLKTSYPYAPPLHTNDPVPTTTVNVSDSSLSSVGTTTEDDYKVGMFLSVTAGGFFDFAKATFKNTATWEWTSKFNQTSSSGTVQSAIVTIGGPAYGYSGPTSLQIYIDNIYKTFAFAIVPVSTQQTTVKGTLKSVDVKPLVTAQVDFVRH
jgi:hypothetical protein